MYVFIDIVMEGFFSHFSVKLTSAFKTAKLNALSMHAICVCVCVCVAVYVTLCSGLPTLLCKEMPIKEEFYCRINNNHNSNRICVAPYGRDISDMSSAVGRSTSATGTDAAYGVDLL